LLRAHRIEREEQILDAIGRGKTRIEAMVKSIYKGYPDELRKPAGRSVLAHLVKLVREGRVVCDTDPPTISSKYRLTR
jgi:hypothetical protein